MRGVQLRHGLESGEVDPLVAQSRPAIGERRGDLPRAELAQAAEVDEQARRPRVRRLQQVRTGDHRQRHLERGLERPERGEHAPVPPAQRSVGQAGLAQRRDEAFERRADRAGIDPCQRIVRLLPREFREGGIGRAHRRPGHRVNAEQVEQAAREQDAAAAADLDAREAAFCGEQRRRHARHPGADHDDVATVPTSARHGVASPDGSAFAAPCGTAESANAAASLSTRSPNSSPNKPQCSASVNSALGRVARHTGSRAGPRRVRRKSRRRRSRRASKSPCW